MLKYVVVCPCFPSWLYSFCVQTSSCSSHLSHIWIQSVKQSTEFANERHYESITITLNVALNFTGVHVISVWITFLKAWLTLRMDSSFHSPVCLFSAITPHSIISIHFPWFIPFYLEFMPSCPTLILLPDSHVRLHFHPPLLFWCLNFLMCLFHYILSPSVWPATCLCILLSQI